MKVFDLTLPIKENMAKFPVPWHPAVEITQLGYHETVGRETRKLIIGTHSGTHIDAPRHFVPGGPTLESIPLSTLVGPARVLDLTPIVQEKQKFCVEDFQKHLGDEYPERLILRFDWSDYWGKPEYYKNHPFITSEAAHWLIDRGVKLIAMDSPQIDSPDHGRSSGNDSPIHKIMLAKGVVFVEYCTNLKALTQKTVTLIVAPLNIIGSDGSPARVMAIEE